MRKTHKTVLRAFLNGESRKAKNLRTDGQTVYLHGNPIIWRSVCGDTDQELFVLTLAGWPTVTTRAVLNAFTCLTEKPLGFYQRNHEQYVSGTIWHVDRGNHDVIARVICPQDCIEIVA